MRRFWLFGGIFSIWENSCGGKLGIKCDEDKKDAFPLRVAGQ